ARTVLGASLALGIALVLSASTAGSLLRRSLVRNIDEVAQVRAADVAALVSQGQLAHGLSSEDGEIVQVVTADGRVLGASRPDAAAEPVSALQPPPGGFRTVTVNRLGGDVGSADQYRLLALRPAGGPGAPVVYVATGLDDVEHHVDVLTRLVFLGLPALMALVGLSAWLAVGRALRPVEAIRAEVADISARELDRRVPESGAGDEVDRLAHTMNAMLGRAPAPVRGRRLGGAGGAPGRRPQRAGGRRGRRPRRRLAGGRRPAAAPAPPDGEPRPGPALPGPGRRRRPPGAAGPRRPRRRRPGRGHPAAGHGRPD